MLIEWVKLLKTRRAFKQLVPLDQFGLGLAAFLVIPKQWFYYVSNLDPSRPAKVQFRLKSATQQPQNSQENIVEVAFYDAFGRILQSDEQSSDQHPTL
jgi:hypothetical protein